jgi:camphor 5-monooxygenase
MNTSLLADRPAHVPMDRVIDFDVYHPPGVEQGFHAAWETLHAPDVPDLVWTPRNGGHWIATRCKLIAAVFSDYERFSNRVLMVPKLIGEDGRDARHIVPSYVDPPEHRGYRILLNGTFAPRTVAALEPKIRELATKLIDAVYASGRCDFTKTYAELLPIQVFMSIVDLPMSDAPLVKSWVEKVTRPNPSLSLEETKQSVRQAHQNIYEYLRPYIEARIGGEGQDMLSRIVNGRIGDRALTPSEMMDMCAQVMFGGLDTVVNALGFAMLFLAQNPQHRQALVAEPSLIPAAVDELLRRFALASLAREVRIDTEFAGVTLRKGEMIVAPTPLAGTDEQVNSRPLDVDFCRASAEQLTFGAGPHRCPGSQLARTEIRVTLEQWLNRIPEFSIAPDFNLAFHGGIIGGVNELPLVWERSADSAAA